MNNPPIDWLLRSDPWTVYRTRLDILGEQPDSSAVLMASEQMVNHPNVRAILDSMTGWPGPVMSSHRSAGQFFHLLPFVADLGVTDHDEPVPVIIEKILNLSSDEGPFGVMTNIPVHFGGAGKDTLAWALCDAPRTVYALAKLGLHSHTKVLKARDHLISLHRPNGFPCAVSKELGRFRGPGRKDDPCPYATLIMLEVLSMYEDLKNSELSFQCIDSLLDIWDNSRTRHPYMFFMGTDFRKLKAPLIWFDIVHVADTLSRFPSARSDNRFIQMVDVMQSKAGNEGKFTPESIWKAWDGWEFGQKKLASPWLTFLVWRIIMRLKG